MNFLTFSLINIAVVSIISTFVARVTRPGIFFAVTVPPGFRRTDTAHRILTLYMAVGWLGAIVIAAVTSLLSEAAALQVGILGTLAVWFAAFFIARYRTLPHAAAPSTVREAVLIARNETVPGGAVALALPFIFLAIRALEVYVRWDAVPAEFPIHWGIHGPDRWVTRSAASVYGSIFWVGLLCFVFVVMAWAIIHASRPSYPRFRRYGAIGLMLLSCVMALTLPAIPGMYLAVPYAPVLIIAVAVGLTVALVIARYGGTQLPGYEPSLAKGDGTSDDHWKLGIIYFNRADPALIVEKRFGIGWTFNFANPWCWIILVLLMGFPVLQKLIR